jgi:hypothetical protein
MFFAGSMSIGGTRATCVFRNRTHSWPEDLPLVLVTFIKKKFSRREAGGRNRT